MMKNALLPILATASNVFSLYALLQSMPVLISDKATLESIENRRNSGEVIQLETRSYSNPWFYVPVAMAAAVSAVCLAQSMGNEPITISNEGMPKRQDAISSNVPPVTIRNQNNNTIQNVTRAAKKQRVEYEPDMGIEDEPIDTQNINGVFTGDILGELAATSLHILISTKSGAGKSTLLKGIIHRILTDNPSAQFSIIDPKHTDWLGLQDEPNVVTYLGQKGAEAKLDAASKVINKVYAMLANRIERRQKAVQTRQPLPQFAPYYLVLDEWFMTHADIARTKRTDEFEEPLHAIISMGRELGVQLILVAVSHNCGEIGFSKPVRNCFSVLALGRVGENHDVGYSPISNALSDAHLFSDKEDRLRLTQSFIRAKSLAAKSGDRPVLLTTMGVPKIALMPDLKHLDGFRFNDNLDDLDNVIELDTRRKA